VLYNNTQVSGTFDSYFLRGKKRNGNFEPNNVDWIIIITRATC
jgi:hypothetical protein